MKYRPVFLIIVLVALLAAACGPSPTPTAVPPAATPIPLPTATATPSGSGDPTWDRIQSTGKIVFGVSPDYKPYEFYNSELKIDGYDPAIARDLGARLGLQVELKDYAFEGLGTALQTGNIDAAISAISVTSNRQVVVDFTDVYFTDQAAALARQGSGIAKLTTPVELAAYRVGVEGGTVYAAYIQKMLVDPGIMPATNLLQYANVDDAVRDLKENRSDLVLMGAIPANEYVSGGGVEVVGLSLTPQLYAIALPKGASVLRDQLNQTLTGMRNDGTLANFGMIYLHVDITQATPVPVPTPTPPAVAPTPGPCYNSMQYVADLSIPDWTVINPGQHFTKSWRINNNGTCAWDSTYRLVFVQGTAMGGAPAVIQGVVNPGANYDISVGLTAPTTPGFYQGWWQMVNGQNVAFGPRIWVAITVPSTTAPTSTVTAPVPTATFTKAPPTPTKAPPTAGPSPTKAPPTAGPTSTDPAPTATAQPAATATNPAATPTTAPPTPTTPPPAPTAVPTTPAKPVISSFSATPPGVQINNTVTLSWSFSGDSLATSKLTRTDPDGTIVTLASDMATTGQYQDVAGSSGTLVYTLVVSNEFGGTTTASTTVTVSAPK